VQVWRAEILYENPVDNYMILVHEGTIADKTGGPPDYTGVFTVSFSPTLAGDNFKIVLRLNGLDVDATAEYRTKPLVILPAPVTSAPNCNYTILTQPGQEYREYDDQPESTSYIYITGNYIRILIDARDEFDNLRFNSETDVFQVVLTGQVTGADVSGAAVAMGNGSYVAHLQFT